MTQLASITLDKMSEQPCLPLSAHVCFALYSTSLAMTKAYKPFLESLGLTYPQYLVLLCLWEQDKQTVTDLGQALGLDSGTLTPLLKRLAVLGVITRSRNPNDERQVCIQLTTQGQALKTQAAKIPACILAASNIKIDAIPALTQQLQFLRQQLQTMQL